MGTPRRHQNHKKNKYTATTIAEWRKRMKDEGISRPELAVKLGLSSSFVNALFARDAIGDLQP